MRRYLDARQTQVEPGSIGKDRQVRTLGILASPWGAPAGSSGVGSGWGAGATFGRGHTTPQRQEQFVADSPLEGGGFEPSVPLWRMVPGPASAELRQVRAGQLRFAPDSPLEEAGFELFVPLRTVILRAGGAVRGNQMAGPREFLRGGTVSSNPSPSREESGELPNRANEAKSLPSSRAPPPVRRSP